MIIISRQSTVNFDSLCSRPQSRTNRNQNKAFNVSEGAGKTTYIVSARFRFLLPTYPNLTLLCFPSTSLVCFPLP